MIQLQLAKWISRLGHPLVIIPSFVFIVTFQIHDTTAALGTATGIIGTGIIPLAIWNFVKTRQGSYSNFDVSERKQRFSMYGFIFMLSILVLAFLHYTDQPQNILIGFLLMVEVLLLSFIFNFWIKSSLHTAVVIYIAIAFLPIHFFPAILLIIASPAIGWSRWALQKHSKKEVLCGFSIGLLAGIQLLYWTGSLS